MIKEINPYMQRISENGQWHRKKNYLNFFCRFKTILILPVCISSSFLYLHVLLVKPCFLTFLTSNFYWFFSRGQNINDFRPCDWFMQNFNSRLYSIKSETKCVNSFASFVLHCESNKTKFNFFKFPFKFNHYCNLYLSINS